MPQLSSFLAFKPSFFQSMKGYSKEKLIKDITAGLTVGVVALPLAMAAPRVLRPPHLRY